MYKISLAGRDDIVYCPCYFDMCTYIKYTASLYRIIPTELDRSTLGDDTASTWVAKPEVHAEVQSSS